jgi:adenylate kinase family enzyme
MTRRIAVKGTSGAGKTTVAAKIAARLGVPHIELDALHHGPNWAEPTADEFQAKVQAALAANPAGWVIDGNYERKLGDLVNDAADVVVWLDLPLAVLLGRLVRRSVPRIISQQELWPGTDNRESWYGVFLAPNGLIIWAVRSYFRHQREWPRRFSKHPHFVRLRSQRQIDAWLAQQ